ncbi:MAG: hypothetical protein ACI86M_000257 [Saprospiraceae bacterium]|jgi:hypothetical protein
MLKMTEEEFLETGLLEQYVMGLLADKESLQVEEYIASHPEVNRLYQEHQKGILEMAESNSISPSPNVRTSLMNEINTEKKKSTNKMTTGISMAIVFAMVMTAIASYAIMKLRDTTRALNEQEMKFALLELDCKKAKRQSEKTNLLFAFYQDEKTELALLRGNAKAPNFNLFARHNKNSGQIALEILNPLSLPENKILCLWGDRDGEMILITKLDKTVQDKLITYDIQMVSFNVTIEERAEEIDHPDVSQLIASVAI